MKYFLMVFLLFPIACGNETNPPSQSLIDGNENLNSESIPYPEIQKPKWTRHNWKPQWNEYIEEALDRFGQHLLSDQYVFRKKDLQALECTGFETATITERKAFFALLFASISYKESAFNPRTRYWEKTMGKYSEGLLQLSVDDRTRHKHCPLTKKNILDPKINLTCGLSILIDQLERRYEDGVNGVLFPKKSYYWLVLTSKTKYEVKDFFRSYAKKYFKFC